MSPAETVARVLREHDIIGVDHPRQGAGQVVPEPCVLCLSCGWMAASSYGAHIAAEVVAALGLDGAA